MSEAISSGKVRRGSQGGKLVGLAAAASAGILLADRFLPPLEVLALLCALLVPIALVANQGAARYLLPILAGGVFAAMHLARLDAAARFPLAGLLRTHPSISVEAKGIVAEEPAVNSRGDRCKYTLRLIEIDDSERRWSTWHRIVVDQPGIPPAYGALLSVRGNLEPVRPARNPGEFSLESFYSRKGVVGEIYLDHSNRVRLLEEGRGNPLFEVALTSRKWIRSAITRGLADAPEVGAVLAAMVLGDRNGTPPEIEERFRHSGALHIFAVSGLHVGIFGTILWFFLRLFGLRRSSTVIIIIPCLFFYAYVTGLRPSAFRAAIMAAIFLGGFVFARQPRLLNSLAAAALVILAGDSQQLFLPGFQLSFAVLAAIALLANPIQKPLARWAEPDSFLPASLVPRWRKNLAKAGRHSAALVAVSAAAWIGSTPLGLFHFKLVTPVALVANCVLVPLAWVILMIATLSLAASAIGLGALGVLFNQVNWCAAKALLGATSLFSAIPGGHFYVDHIPSWSGDRCRVTVLDTGLGGSAQLVSVAESGSHFLIDAAGRETYHEAVLPFLRGTLHTGLEGLFLTHGDAQHFAGAIPLLADYPPPIVFQSALDNRSPYHDDFLDALHSSPPPRPLLRTVAAGDTPFASPSGSSSLHVLYPPPGMRHDYASDDQCLVLRLDCESWRILFLADSGFATEKWLLANVAPGDLACDVLVKGRHRSDYSGLPEFLRAASPRFVVATNFSFPVTEQIPAAWEELLASRNIVLLDQSRTGAVTIRLSSKRLRLSGYLSGDSFFLERP